MQLLFAGFRILIGLLPVFAFLLTLILPSNLTSPRSPAMSRR